jgi:hypothetical protein
MGLVRLLYTGRPRLGKLITDQSRSREFELQPTARVA